MSTAELALALTLDATVGEPPASWHPVVGMGRLIDRLEARLPAEADPTAGRAGAVAAVTGIAVVAVAAVAARRLPWPARGVLLWTLLSGRMLRDEVAAVEQALVEGGVDGGRARVAWLVSRDTSRLGAADVRAAAVQTLAENTADGFVATLWWWSVGGLPAAAVHRFTDTLDSRWGYLDERWTRRGRAAARVDDLLAAVPARLTALLWRGRLDARLRAEADRTPSPNGGWPMGAAALALDTRLEKPGSYVLHAAGDSPDGTTVPAALRAALRVQATAALLTLAASRLRRPRRTRLRLTEVAA